MACTGSITGNSKSIWTSDLYMISPENKLLVSEANKRSNFPFEITPIYDGLKVEFSLYVRNTDNWVSQNDTVNCILTQIDTYNIHLAFEDGGGDNPDVNIDIHNDTGFVIDGQNIYIQYLGAGKRNACYRITENGKTRIRNIRDFPNINRDKNFKHKKSDDSWGGITL